MNNFITRITILITFLFVTTIIYSQDHTSKIDSIISLDYGTEDSGIANLVAKYGKPIYDKVFGKSNLELNTPMKLNAVFQIGSITKQFTAVSILMLAEQGKLNIKDNIEKYFPEYASNWKNITIHHLLNYTSGIKNSTPVGGKGFVSRTDMTPKELIAYFKNEPLEFKPSENFKYSNAGYILLGRIIELVSEQSYEDFIEKIFLIKLE
jgi:CubicO group peptidase (beta-lactamase class C family)